MKVQGISFIGGINHPWFIEGYHFTSQWARRCIEREICTILESRGDRNIVAIITYSSVPKSYFLLFCWYRNWLSEPMLETQTKPTRRVGDDPHSQGSTNICSYDLG